MKGQGTVYLVGAGPGDVGLMTLRGAELLARADVVVYDALCNPELLRLASQTAEVIFGGKRAGDETLSQEQLTALLISKAKAGKTVVRLKGGDPYIFGRGGEEAERLADAKVPFEVVSGVSSFVAVPNYAGVPLTHRDYASRLTIVTGHGNPEEDHSAIDWPQVARTPGTKVIMMGTERIGAIAESLIANGMAPATPIAMVSWGTTGRQQSIDGTLATIGKLAVDEKIPPPTVAIVGDVVKLRSKLNWYERKPMFGQRVVVTRAREQGGQMAGRLRELGAEVLEVPTIKLDTPTRRQDIIDALLELNSYDWLVFTSPNGVAKFFEYFFRQFHDMRDLGGARIAAVGPATASKLKELHLQVDLMPEEALAVNIAKEFSEFESIENLKICLLRAEVANRELPEALEALGAIVDDIACYRTIPEVEDRTGVAKRLEGTGADWVAFTSGSTVENFHARFDLPEMKKRFPRLRLASIGPETSRKIAALGLKPDVEAKPHSIEALTEAMVQSSARSLAR